MLEIDRERIGRFLVGEDLVKVKGRFIPCSEACEWIISQSTYDIQTLWECCPNGKWMDYLLFIFNLYEFLSEPCVTEKLFSFCDKYNIHINITEYESRKSLRHKIDLITTNTRINLLYNKELADLMREMVPNVKDLLERKRQSYNVK